MSEAALAQIPLWSLLEAEISTYAEICKCWSISVCRRKKPEFFRSLRLDSEQTLCIMRCAQFELYRRPFAGKILVPSGKTIRRFVEGVVDAET